MKNILSIGFVVFCLTSAQSLWAACNANLRLSKPDVIYTDNGNGTITDEKTGLIWQKCSVGLSGDQCDSGAIYFFDWSAALEQASVQNAAVFAGFSDWRLPSVAELRSLVEDACEQPSINATFFPATYENEYWTSSPYIYPLYDTNAWYISFDDGRELHEYKDKIYAVRLVRSRN